MDNILYHQIDDAISQIEQSAHGFQKFYNGNCKDYERFLMSIKQSCDVVITLREARARVAATLHNAGIPHDKEFCAACNETQHG